MNPYRSIGQRKEQYKYAQLVRKQTKSNMTILPCVISNRYCKIIILQHTKQVKSNLIECVVMGEISKIHFFQMVDGGLFLPSCIRNM